MKIFGWILFVFTGIILTLPCLMASILSFDSNFTESLDLFFCAIFGAVLMAIFYFKIIKFDKQKWETKKYERQIKYEAWKIDRNKKLESLVPELNDIGGKNWETIYLNTKRWNEVELQLNTKLEGYGKLFKREYDVWYVDKGSKEKKSIQQHTEITQEYHWVNNYKHITNTWVDFNDLINKNGYLELYSGLDEKKTKRWYFGLKKETPLYIITKKNKY